jgi:Sec-independent protein translocase protein TatA
LGSALGKTIRGFKSEMKEGLVEGEKADAPAKDARFCAKCGAPNEDPQAAFCAKCGEKLA